MVYFAIIRIDNIYVGYKSTAVGTSPFFTLGTYLL